MKYIKNFNEAIEVKSIWDPKYIESVIDEMKDILQDLKGYDNLFFDIFKGTHPGLGSYKRRGSNYIRISIIQRKPSKIHIILDNEIIDILQGAINHLHSLGFKSSEVYNRSLKNDRFNLVELNSLKDKEIVELIIYFS